MDDHAHQQYQKWKGQVAHVKQRFRERFGIEVTLKELNRMVRQIETGQALRVAHKENVYAVRLRYRWYKVAYDAETKMVKTVLY